MAEGQGNITYGGVNASGGGAGAITAADNGLSRTGTTVVLGNNRGDATIPAALLNNRSIPLQGFGILFDWEGAGSASTSFFQITTEDTAMLEFYKGTAGQDPMEIITIQGQDPGSNPYGNFWITLDESFTNPDGQIDAVLQWGYNQNGAGGQMNPTEAAVHYAIESHFQAGGGEQMEVHLQSIAKNGQENRIYSFEVNKPTGGCTGYFTCSNLSFFNDNTGTDPYFQITGPQGQAVLFGTAPSISLENELTASGQFSVTSNVDGSVSVENNTTGGNPTIAFNTNQSISWTNPAFAGIQLNIPNDDGIEGVFVSGSVSAGSGTCFAFLATVDASGPLVSQLANTGAGDSVFQAVVEGAGNSFFRVANSGFADVFAFGLDQSDGNFRMAAAQLVSGSNVLTITPAGQVGIGGNTAPTAYLHAAASPGTAGTGPLKLTAGTLLAVPEDGTIEYDGTNFYKTIGATRSIIL